MDSNIFISEKFSEEVQSHLVAKKFPQVFGYTYDDDFMKVGRKFSQLRRRMLKLDCVPMDKESLRSHFEKMMQGQDWFHYAKYAGEHLVQIHHKAENAINPMLKELVKKRKIPTTLAKSELFTDDPERHQDAGIGARHYFLDMVKILNGLEQAMERGEIAEENREPVVDVVKALRKSINEVLDMVRVSAVTVRNDYIDERAEDWRQAAVEDEVDTPAPPSVTSLLERGRRRLSARERVDLERFETLWRLGRVRLRGRGDGGGGVVGHAADRRSGGSTKKQSFVAGADDPPHGPLPVPADDDPPHGPVPAPIDEGDGSEFLEHEPDDDGPTPESVENAVAHEQSSDAFRADFLRAKEHRPELTEEQFLAELHPTFPQIFSEQFHGNEVDIPYYILHSSKVHSR